MKKENKELETLYLSYQTTQDSANHFDTINWNIAASFWVLISALIAYVIVNFETFSFLLIIASLIGSFLCFIALRYSFKYNQRIKVKYSILREIEKRIEELSNCNLIKQHRIENKKAKKITDYQIVCVLTMFFFFFVVVFLLLKF